MSAAHTIMFGVCAALPFTRHLLNTEKLARGTSYQTRKKYLSSNASPTVSLAQHLFSICPRHYTFSLTILSRGTSDQTLKNGLLPFASSSNASRTVTLAQHLFSIYPRHNISSFDGYKQRNFLSN